MEQRVYFCCSPEKLQKSMLHSRLLISTKLIRLQGLWQLIRQLVNLVNDSVFPKAANTLFLRKDISSTCYPTFPPHPRLLKKKKIHFTFKLR